MQIYSNPKMLHTLWQIAAIIAKLQISGKILPLGARGGSHAGLEVRDSQKNESNPLQRPAACRPVKGLNEMRPPNPETWAGGHFVLVQLSLEAARSEA